MPYTTVTGLDFLVELLRHRISDPKISYQTEVDEDGGPASGASIESFYTDNMPIATGIGIPDAELKVGRWWYTKVDTPAEAAGIRGFLFYPSSGWYYIPAGAIMPTSADRSYLTYTWQSRNATTFTDQELKMYLGDAMLEVNGTYYDFGFTFVANDPYSMSITPSISINNLGAAYYVMFATYLIKKQLESEGYNDRIMVRDINTTIDTSKGLSDLSKSIKDLRTQFEDMIAILNMRGQEAAFARIDNYSTYNEDWFGQRYDTNGDSDSGNSDLGGYD